MSKVDIVETVRRGDLRFDLRSDDYVDVYHGDATVPFDTVHRKAGESLRGTVIRWIQARPAPGTVMYIGDEKVTRHPDGTETRRMVE